MWQGPFHRVEVILVYGRREATQKACNLVAKLTEWAQLRGMNHNLGGPPMDGEKFNRVTSRSFMGKAGIAGLGTASLAAASATAASGSKAGRPSTQTTYYA